VFDIKIETTEYDSFDYIKVYAIQRTAVDSIPVVRVVTDIKLNETKKEYIVTDTGKTGYSIDSNILLLIGGEELIMNTISTKDNVLFAGNIKNERVSINKYFENNKIESDN
jgi:hypothetical protein